jgi:Ca-activated chloride channel family protein
MVFTVDVSGSQQGAPLAQEKAATRYCLTHMGSEDTFQVIRFGDTSETRYPKPVPADDWHVRDALQWVDSFDAGGGTMLVDGIRTALLFPHEESRLRFVAFMTDGFIGNESEALREIHNSLGPARIFSFGVGSSTNRYLLDHMARMGNGAAAYLGLNDDANVVMADYFARISHPALTNITVDWNGMDASEVFPERIGDLFVGRPVVLSGRFKGPTPRQIIVHGTIGGRGVQLVVPVEAQTVDTSPSQALAAVWARTKIDELSDRAIWDSNEQLPGQIRQISLEYGLESDYTSFVAVDSLTQTAGDHGTTVFVPVPVPDGVRYETTVQGSAPAGARE